MFRLSCLLPLVAVAFAGTGGAHAQMHGHGAHHYYEHYRVPAGYYGGKGQPPGEEGAPLPPEQNFVAPPPEGTIVGESGGVQLEGFELQIPETTLRLPRLRLPVFSQFVRPPRVELARAVAPLAKSVRKEFSIESVGLPDDHGEEGAPLPPPPTKPGHYYHYRAPHSPHDCHIPDPHLSSMPASYPNSEERIRQLESKIDRMEGLMVEMAQATTALARAAAAQQQQQAEPQLTRIPAPESPVLHQVSSEVRQTQYVRPFIPQQSARPLTEPGLLKTSYQGNR